MFSCTLFPIRQIIYLTPAKRDVGVHNLMLMLRLPAVVVTSVPS